ncbi:MULTISPECIES: lipopolysaccharide biosynthesis protein [Clostridium]|uniref:lipopolysaccharide biosynthesis protein n=1 Tax=Clostridium TaxID=1485 RepID=UPI000C07A0F3|nr:MULTISPECIES: oligosaccharide flippase family protein [Clostridium]MBS4958722.1 oligosaccharide flippase family protein [Clostridium sp.]MDB1941160.1 oligosaccharide flippase family protein [Clostridium tertium]MDU2157226.1 oligosaccharide flippase family protein [Clostridium sp.]MDU3525433.1 oligosaccharide flippase family protein [Clostridium sp.]MDU3548916.1 oligosaccharide flippase family protein [Clostridium sp.]
MKDFIKFIKSSGIYFFGNILTKLISFLLLPIYTKFINPTDYGTYDLMIAYITFFTSVLFLDIWSGIMRFMFDYDKVEDKYKSIFTGSSIFIISTALYSISIFIFSRFIKVDYIIYIYLYGLLMNLQNLSSFIVRGLGKNITYVVSGMISTIVTLTCNIVFLVYLKWDYSSLYISSCLGFFISSIINLKSVNYFRKDFYKYFNKDIFLNLLKFSLPLCLNSTAYWFLTSYNKVVITNNLSAYDNGLYTVAAKFSVAITLLTSCFQMAWQEISYSKGMDENNKNFYSEAINLYIKFLTLGILGLISVVYLIFPFMVDSQYGEAKNIIPLYLLATLASCLSSFIGNIFGAIKHTKSIFITMVASSLANVIIINLLINKIGINAASISLFIGFVINVILRIFILKKKLMIKIDYKFIIMSCILFIYVYLTYVNGGIALNIVSVIVVLITTLYIFKDYLLIFYNKITKNIN